MYMWEILNDEMDERAKVYWRESVNDSPLLNYKTLQGMWNMTIHGIQVVNKFNKFVYDAIQGAYLGELWIEKGRSNKRAFDLIDWKYMKIEMKH